MKGSMSGEGREGEGTLGCEGVWGESTTEAGMEAGRRAVEGRKEVEKKHRVEERGRGRGGGRLVQNKGNPQEVECGGWEQIETR